MFLLKTYRCISTFRSCFFFWPAVAATAFRNSYSVSNCTVTVRQQSRSSSRFLSGHVTARGYARSQKFLIDTLAVTDNFFLLCYLLFYFIFVCFCCCYCRGYLSERERFKGRSKESFFWGRGSADRSGGYTEYTYGRH